VRGPALAVTSRKEKIGGFDSSDLCKHANLYVKSYWPLVCENNLIHAALERCDDGMTAVAAVVVVGGGMVVVATVVVLLVVVIKVGFATVVAVLMLVAFISMAVRVVMWW
jgi:hypothetical protein